MEQHGQPAPGYTSNAHIQQVQQPPGAVLTDKQQYAPQVQQQQYQQPVQVQAPASNYQTAMPLASLQAFPAPVDCPVCGVRQMTAVSEEIGGYTQ